MPFKNPDVKKEYMKIYNATEKYKEYRATRITCSCGLEVTHHQMSEHKKTNRHLNLVNKLAV